MPQPTYHALIGQLDELVSSFENHPDPAVREQVIALLSGIDLLHREGLWRLVDRLREEGAGPALERARRDPVVEILLGLYGLAELPSDEAAPQAAPPTAAAREAGGAVMGFVPADHLTMGRTEARAKRVAP